MVLHASARVRAVEAGRSFGEHARSPRAALSLHGLLIPNFADNGRGASFSPFYADTLVERRTYARARMDFARPPGPNAPFFFPPTSPLPLPPSPPLVFLFLSFLFRFSPVLPPSLPHPLSLSLSLSLSLPLPLSLSLASFYARRGENMVFVPHSHRKPSTAAEGSILWRVWGKADINAAGTTSSAGRQG